MALGLGASQLAGLLLGIVPFVLFTAIGYHRWRRHYGTGNGILGYYFRYMTNKRATEDAQWVFLLKGAISVIWFMACLTLFVT